MNKILCTHDMEGTPTHPLMSVVGVMYRHIALKASVRENDQCLMSYTGKVNLNPTWSQSFSIILKYFYVHMINDVKFTDEFDGVYFSNWSERENVYPQFPDFFVQSLHIFLLPFLRFLIDFKSDKLFNTKI